MLVLISGCSNKECCACGTTFGFNQCCDCYGMNSEACHRAGFNSSHPDCQEPSQMEQKTKDE